MNLREALESAPQEVFDFIAAHLLKQNQKAMRNGGCVYRSPTGLMCAVGCLLSDKEYAAIEEGEGVRSIAYTVMPSLDDYNPVIPLLIDLQDVHDDSAPCEWLTDLHQLAANRGLNTDALPRLPE